MIYITVLIVEIVARETWQNHTIRAGIVFLIWGAIVAPMKDELTFTVQVFKEGKQYVSFNPELEVASCGYTPQEAKDMLRKAIRVFLKAAGRQGTLDTILEEAGFVRAKKRWHDPYMVTLDRMSVSA